MSQLARIYRNLIDAEAYVVEHREWLDGLFHPIGAPLEVIQKAYEPGRKPMADPKTALPREESFVRRTND